MSVLALLPPPLADDERTARVAATVAPEVEALVTAAATLPRLAERLVSPTYPDDAPIPRAALDQLARYLGVGFYDAEVSDETVRAVVLGAFEWHRRRGTPFAVRWVLDVLGLPHAEVLEAHDIKALPRGYHVLDADPPWLLSEEVGGEPARTLARWALDSDLPDGLSWAEYVVRIDLDDEATAGGWGTHLARGVELSAPAGRHARFVLTFGDPTEWRAAGAMLEARAAFGPGYAYSYLPTISGVPLDGSWDLRPSAVHVRRPSRADALGKVAHPADTLPLPPVPDSSGYTALQLDDDTATLFGPVVVETYEAEFDGVSYTRARARLVDYPATRSLQRDGTTLSVPSA